MTLLLDTSVLIDVLRNRKGRRALLASLIESGHTLSTTSINIAEIYSGMRPQEEIQTSGFLDSLECYPITVAIARHAGSLKFAAAQRGRTLTLADMLIAATALEHRLTLLTDNRKDFTLSGLKLYPLP